MVGGHHVAGHTLWAADSDEEARIHSHRGALVSAGNRSEHGDIQSARCSADQVAAGAAAREVGALREGRGHGNDQRLSRSKLGTFLLSFLSPGTTTQRRVFGSRESYEHSVECAWVRQWKHRHRANGSAACLRYVLRRVGG